MTSWAKGFGPYTQPGAYGENVFGTNILSGLLNPQQANQPANGNVGMNTQASPYTQAPTANKSLLDSLGVGIPQEAFQPIVPSSNKNYMDNILAAITSQGGNWEYNEKYNTKDFIGQPQTGGDFNNKNDWQNYQNGISNEADEFQKRIDYLKSINYFNEVDV